jgi:ParB-like chromosome segregation protein Spo0J
MLPAYPWTSRPDDHPLTADEVCEALVQSRGYIHRAAERLKVGSLILRKFIERSSRARAVLREMDALRIDRAVEHLDEALDSEDNRRQDWAIRYTLNSRNARPYGWGSADDADDAAKIRGPLVNLTLQAGQWADGTTFGPATPKEAAKQLIDVTPKPPPASKPTDND